MQFQVPQFLDVEDKVIGPLTVKQFLFLAGGVGFAYLCYHFINFLGLGAILGLGFIAFGSALAFYRPNKKPFAKMLESAFNYTKSTRLYVWKRRDNKPMSTELSLDNFQMTKHTGSFPIAGTGNKLNELTWSMDVNTNQVPAENIHSDSAII